MMPQTSETLIFNLVILLAISIVPANGDDEVINTPSMLSSIEGVWQLASDKPEAYVQRLYLGQDSVGQWLRDKESVLTPITYYIEGHELLVQYYHETDVPKNFRVKQERFRYKLKGAQLILTDESETTKWTRGQATGVRIDRNSYSIREFRVNDHQSVFTVDMRGWDAQLGIGIAVELSRIADARGFKFAVGRRGPDTNGASWVDFYKERPTKDQVSETDSVLTVANWAPMFKDMQKRWAARKAEQKSAVAD